MDAVKRGDREAVERELAADPSLAASDEGGTSVVLLALYHREEPIARLLAGRKGALSVFEAAALGEVAALRACLERDPAAANAVAPDGFFPLGLAAFFRRPDAVEVLLAAGADVSAVARNPMQVTALHSAVADGGDARIARALVAAGADVNARQRHGWTPLHGAADSGDAGLVELLLARGADPDAKHDGGKTALDVAREKGHAAVVAVLERSA